MSTSAERAEIAGQEFTIEGVAFTASLVTPSTPDRFTIAKNPAHVDRYRDVVASLPEAPTIVELGIAQGGSLVMLDLIADPSVLVAFDLSPDRIPALDAFVEGRPIHPYFGVDQSDTATIHRYLDRHLAGPIDLLIDDASHVYEPTRASFDALFPRLSPGGWYLIEDWATDHIIAETVEQVLAGPDGQARDDMVALTANPSRPRTPMSRFAVEATLALSLPGDIVAEMSVNENWIAIRRGTEVLPVGWTLSDAYRDHFGYLTP